jgi:hypothetical protein
MIEYAYHKKFFSLKKNSVPSPSKTAAGPQEIYENKFKIPNIKYNSKNEVPTKHECTHSTDAGK